MLATSRPRYHSLDLGAQGLCWPHIPVAQGKAAAPGGEWGGD